MTNNIYENRLTLGSSWGEIKSEVLHEYVKKAGQVGAHRDIKRIAAQAKVSREFLSSLLSYCVQRKGLTKTYTSHENPPVKKVLAALGLTEAEFLKAVQIRAASKTS